MAVDTALHIGDFDIALPDGTIDKRAEGDDNFRHVKAVLVRDLGGITAAVTSTHTELNYLDGTTLGTVVASKAVAADANLDISGFRNVTITGIATLPSISSTVINTTLITGASITDGTATLVAGTLTGATLASGTIATTQSASDSTTKVATTAFVQQELASVPALSLHDTLTTTSGTSHEVGTDFPADTEVIKISVKGVSSSGTDKVYLELRDSSGYSSTSVGYVLMNGVSVLGSSYSGGPVWLESGSISAGVITGNIELVKNGNNWTVSSVLCREDFNLQIHSTGSVDLASDITRLKFTLSGSNTFDAGAISVYVYG